MNSQDNSLDDYKNPYQSFGMVAADAGVDSRTEFIRKTYLHLAGAILAFIALEAVLMSFVTQDMMMAMFGGQFSMLIVFGAFMGASYVADSWARSAVSPGKQYAGLGLYVVVQATICLPAIYFAANFSDPNIIPVAGGITLLMFGALTAIVWFTGADFSFMRSFLALGGFAAMGYFICSMFIPGLPMGFGFAVLMILLMCGYILYYTSNVLHHYHIGQHVAASLALFASIATLFRFVLLLLMSRR